MDYKDEVSANKKKIFNKGFNSLKKGDIGGMADAGVDAAFMKVDGYNMAGKAALGVSDKILGKNNIISNVGGKALEGSTKLVSGAKSEIKG